MSNRWARLSSAFYNAIVTWTVYPTLFLQDHGVVHQERSSISGNDVVDLLDASSIFFFADHGERFIVPRGLVKTKHRVVLFHIPNFGSASMGLNRMVWCGFQRSG